MRWIFPARLPDIRDFHTAVHDGDTLWLETDRGTRFKALMDIRLLDVRAPELNEPGGIEAQQWVYAWFDAHDNEPWPFYVETFKTRSGADRKTLDRYLGIVTDYDPQEFAPESLRDGCLNRELMAWLKEYPEWGPGKLVGDA